MGAGSVGDGKQGWGRAGAPVSSKTCPWCAVRPATNLITTCSKAASPSHALYQQVFDVGGGVERGKREGGERKGDGDTERWMVTLKKV